MFCNCIANAYAKAGDGIGEHTNGKIGTSILIKELADRKKKIKHLNQELIRKKGILNKNFGDILNN